MYTLEDCAGGIIAHHSSTMFRNILIEFPDWYWTAGVGDWPLQILHAEHGPIGYLDDVMGVYRIQPGGIWYGWRANYTKGLESAIQRRKLLISHLSPEHKPLFRRHLYKRYYALTHSLVDCGETQKAREYARKCLSE